MVLYVHPDSKVHGTNMGPIWDRQGPGGPHGICYLGRFSIVIALQNMPQQIQQIAPMEMLYQMTRLN